MSIFEYLDTKFLDQVPCPVAINEQGLFTEKHLTETLAISTLYHQMLSFTSGQDKSRNAYLR